MPSSLTATKIKDTYGQVLHVDGGVTSTPKSVYDGDGTATALKVSTTDVQVNNSPVLTDADIGVSVQAYDADLTSWAGKTAPSGTVVGTSDSQALSNKSFSDNPVFSAGTANGVAYLNGSKVLTTGSALTFDGTSLGVVGNLSLQSANGTINFKNAVGTTIQQIFYDDADGSLTVGGGAGSFPVKFRIGSSEQMRLTSTGLGIGTASLSGLAQRTIDLNAASNSALVFKAADATFAYLYADNAANEFRMYGGSSKNLTFYANAAEGMRLTSTGLGIGTSSPDTKLDVRGEVSIAYNATYGLRFYNQDRNNWSSIGNNTATGNTSANLVFKTGTGTMTFDNAGNLGLGVTPSAWGGSYRANQIGLSAAFYGHTGVGLAAMSNNVVAGASTENYMTSAPAASYSMFQNTHRWFTAPSGTAGNAISFTQAMTLDASGNLAVGTTTPLVTASGRGNITINGSTDSLLAFGNAGAVSGYIFASSSAFTVNSQSAKPIVFEANGSERMRIDSSGNVGIGTSSPGAKLDVNGLVYIRSGSYLATNGIYGYDSDVNISTNNGGSNVIKLSTGAGAGTERMRIDSSGNLLVGTTSTLGVGKGIHSYANGSPALVLKRGTDAGGIANFINYNGSSVGTISVDSGNTSYNTTSDYRLKENIQPMQNALDVVAQLNPVTYTWKADGSDGQGFIAHELQAVVPDCVTGEKDAVDADGNPVYQGIDTSFLSATLTRAIQELKSIVDAQAAEIAELKAKLA